MIGGVDPGELVRYLGYEAVFVVGPGWLVLRALAPGVRSRAWQLSLGWPLGLTLEILAFSLTAALGIRDAFLIYPLLVGIPAALIARRRSQPRASSPPALFTPASRWVIAGLCLLAFAYVGGAYYTLTPLPGTVPGVVYPSDSTFHIAVAASALHHWPPESLGVSGQPFHYHYFVHLHMAAISQVTGLHLPLIVFRLYLVPLIGLLLLQAALAGRLIGGRPWAGVLTVALFLLVREIDLSFTDTWPFAGIGAIHLWLSPSQLLGMTLFIPTFVVLACLLDPGLAARAAPQLSISRRELWVLLALLLIGDGGAKSVILPLLIGGLVLLLGWIRLRDSRFDRTALTALALCLALFAVFYLLMYRGAHGLNINPPATIEQMLPIMRLHNAWPGGLVADAAFWILAVPGGTLMYFGAPLLGLIWVLRRPRPPLETSAVLSLSLLAVGAVAFFFLQDEFLEQTYFTLFGLTAVFPLAASGLVRLADSWVTRPGLNWPRFALFALGWVEAAIVLGLLADRLVTRGHYLRADALLYVSVVVAIGALALAAILFRGRLRALFGTFAAMAVLLTAALDTPLDVIPHTIRFLDAGAPLYGTSETGLRPRELTAMDWIRDHVDQDAVLAVSNDRTPKTRALGPSDNDYPAFTEHRTFREGWAFTAKANEIGERKVAPGHVDPFPDRTALERAVFVHGDPGALRTMVERYGVTDIVVSKKDGKVSPRVYRLGRLIYSNPAVDVIEVG